MVVFGGDRRAVASGILVVLLLLISSVAVGPSPAPDAPLDQVMAY